MFSDVHKTHGRERKMGTAPGIELSSMHNQKLAWTPESPLAIHHNSTLDVNEHKAFIVITMGPICLREWLMSLFIVYWTFLRYENNKICNFNLLQANWLVYNILLAVMSHLILHGLSGVVSRDWCNLKLDAPIGVFFLRVHASIHIDHGYAGITRQVQQWKLLRTYQPKTIWGHDIFQNTALAYVITIKRYLYKNKLL